MEAIQRELSHNNWVTLVLLFAFGLLFILEILSKKKLKGYFSALFNKGFLELELEETNTTFPLFQGVLFLFSTVVFALIAYFINIEYISNPSTGFLTFIKIYIFLFSFFTLKRFLEVLLVKLFSLQIYLQFFIFSKNSYFYTISILSFILLIIYTFGFKNPLLLVSFLVLIFLVKTTILIVNNKNLILNQLFYFILYLCTLEIAPLILLIKRIF